MDNHYEKIVVDYITALQNRTTAEDVVRFYHPDAQQIEFPNTLTKNTTIRTVHDLKEASNKGKHVLTNEEYEIMKMFSSGSTVIIEAVWTGTLAIPLGTIPAGGQMKAYFAQFFEFKEDKIFRQRNYDCFEPFA